MSEVSLGFDRHETKCPHCQEQTEHFSPGSMILFARARCVHCGSEFLIVQNEPWLEGKPGSTRK